MFYLNKLLQGRAVISINRQYTAVTQPAGSGHGRTSIIEGKLCRYARSIGF